MVVALGVSSLKGSRGGIGAMGLVGVVVAVGGMFTFAGGAGDLSCTPADVDGFCPGLEVRLGVTSVSGGLFLIGGAAYWGVSEEYCRLLS